MCSGRVDLEFILRAFHNGMDGVFIGACRLGECNYVTHGNYHALNMVLLCQKILEYVGINPDRLRIEFMSAGDGILFTEVVEDFTEGVRALGPLGVSEGLDPREFKDKLQEVMKLVPYIKITKREKLDTRLESKQEYADFYSREEIEQLFSEVVSYYIDPQKCQGCMICARRCPVEAIEGGKKRIHVIDQDKCIKCGTCFAACPSRFAAVQKMVGQPAPPPLPLDKREIA